MKKNHVMSLALVGALSISLLAGCGGGETGEDTGNTANAIRLGGIGPLTGANAIYGLATKQGAEVALKEVNALGDLQFTLDFQDDEADPEKAVNAYTSLKDKDMQILYGCTTTGSCITVAGETYADRYFQLTPSASSPDVTAGKDNAFQICFTDPNLGITAADYIYNNKLAERVAIIYNNGDPYSTGIANTFMERADELGLNLVAKTAFPDDTNTDFNVQLKEAQAADADLLFMPIYFTPASLVLSQANAMGYQPIFFGGDGMDGLLKMDGFDATLAEGLMLMTPFNASATDERTVNFVTEYTEAYGDTTLNQFAADGYDCIYAIYEACKKAGITPEMSHEDVCEKLIATFTDPSFSVDGLTGTGMTWGTNGEVSKAPVVVEVHDGVYVTR